MQGHYGTRFLNMWLTGHRLPNGDDAGLANAMNHWAEKLGGYADHPETLKRALSNLPPEPPTLPQFMELCRHSWAPPIVQQLENKPTEEQLAKNRERIREIIAMFNGNGNGFTITGTKQ